MESQGGDNEPVFSPRSGSPRKEPSTPRKFSQSTINIEIPVSQPPSAPTHQRQEARHQMQHQVVFLGFFASWFMRHDVSLAKKMAVSFVPLCIYILTTLTLICIQSGNLLSLILVIATCVVFAITALLTWLLIKGTNVRYQQLIDDHKQCVDVEAATAKFVPSELLALLGHHRMMDVKNGDRTLINTVVMFCGLRNFTLAVSRLTADETFEWLMQFTNVMTPIVRRKRGLVDKYLGDGFMILNRIPTLALTTAIEMQTAIDGMNEEQVGRKSSLTRYKTSMGTGIHSGVVCVGTLGDAGRLDTTLISNVVNLASRFELLTKHYGCRIVMSLTCAKRVKIERYAHRSLGRVRVKGSKESHELVDVYCTDHPDDRKFKKDTRDDFETGLRLYRDQRWEHAMMKFKQSAPSCNPEDPAQKAALVKLSFCKKYQTEGTPYDGWYGEDVWDRK